MKNNIVILGGGTAGWMTANILKKKLGTKVNVQVVASSKIATVGVGEGSTPLLRDFFDLIDVKESEWMPICHATFKLGIKFENWTSDEEFKEYFHPFYSYFDRDHVKALIHNSLLRRTGKKVVAHPDIFTFSSYLAEQRCSPLPPINFPFDNLYGYHFDAGLLAEFLKKKAIAQGVEFVDAEIIKITQSNNGNIESLQSRCGAVFQGDFFIDCTGFKAALMRETLGVNFKSYNESLLNDSAVTFTMPPQNNPITATTSTALTNGWCWHIPLQNRTGHGYVYSSKYCSAAEAERELRQYLKIDEDVKANHLSWQVGRLEHHWKNNCIAIGLSQGFIEPLEATGLVVVQQTLLRFVDYYRNGKYNDRDINAYNVKVNNSFDNIKDYILVHYLANSRTDSQYWRDNRGNSLAFSDNLKQIFHCWFNRGDLTALLKKLNIDKYYTSNSWHYIFSGMGLFPEQNKLVTPSNNELKQVDVAYIRGFFQRCLLNFDSHEIELSRQHKKVKDEL